MKAVYLNQHGNIENLIYSQDFEKPNPKENEVLIKILYTTINRIDLTLRKGYEIDKKSTFTFPKILGSDAVGVIESFGIGKMKMEADFKIGDKVLILPYFYLEGNKFNLGINYQGTYAEYISIPIQSIIKLNSNLDIINFAALPTSGLIAYKCLTNFFFNEIDKSAKNLLLIGGNSGVGTFIIQLAKLLNFNIITTIGNPKNTNILKDLGANEIYNHYDDDFKDKLISKHSNYFDLIIDFQGGEYLNLYLGKL